MKKLKEELDILKIIADNPSMSQRKIAEQTGISLGQVNFLIKKCVKKGLIKIEGQTTKSIKYNLTPKGIAEKAALTMQYIKISYNAIVSLTDNIKKIAEQYNLERQNVFVYGDNDEMMGIVKLALGNIPVLTYPVENAVIFYWDEDKMRQKEDELKLLNCKYINILK